MPSLAGSVDNRNAHFQNANVDRPRVLVAGANYGRAYMSALAHAQDRLELVGILASGSLRSVRASAEFGVPLYQSAAELPEGLDLACVAVGSRGFPVVLDLLRRRIPVLCEHPVPPPLLESALQETEESGTAFHVNGHFAILPSSRGFMRCFSSLGEDPVFFDLLATDRSLYAALDILFQCFGPTDPLQIAFTKQGQPFSIIEATLGGIPLMFRLQFAGGQPIPDGDASYLVDYRITAGFGSGLLTLLSMGGPVVWTANYACPSKLVPIEDRQASPEALRTQRLDANLEAIDRILEKRMPPEQLPLHLRAVSGAWQQIGDAVRSSS